MRRTARFWRGPLQGLALPYLLVGGLCAQTSGALFEQVDGTVKVLSEITGWKVQRKVPSEILSKTSFRSTMEAQMKESSASKEVKAEELALKLFGLVPPDFNLAQETVDLVTEQAAAFYDYHKKRLFVLDSTTDGTEQRVALAHELAHALADQQYNLGKFLNKGSPDDDATTARQAVMEGQASWLSWAYISTRNGGKPQVPEALLEQLTRAMGTSSGEFPVLAGEPLYIRESLIFPYDQGLRFQDAVYRKLGNAAFDEVLQRPPSSTQQIMHPEAYLAGVAPLKPDLPALPDYLGKDAGHYRLTLDGALGEFDFGIMLRQYAGERDGAEVASHWRGGGFRLYQQKRSKTPVLAYAGVWDSPDSARAFFELYKNVLAGKWKKMEIASSKPEEVTGSGDSGRFVLRLTGATVQCVEGLPSASVVR